jgi:ketosteroid isomerase-like protein
MRIDRRGRGAAVRRFAALAAALTLVLGTAACGDSADDDSGASAKPAADSGGTTTVVSGTPEEQIRASYTRFTGAVVAQDAARVCASMSPKFQRQTGGKASCVKTMEKTFESGPPAKERATVRTVKVSGNKATARVKVAGQSQVSLVKYAKLDGEWLMSGYGGQVQAKK